MENLERYVKHFFGAAKPDGTHFAVINNAHVVHESGFEVKFSHSSITYNDGHQIVSLDVDFGSGGELIIFGKKIAGTEVLLRILAALSHLGVQYAIE